MSTAVKTIVPHEDHQDVCARINFWRATFEGGEKYKLAKDECGEPVLPQYEHETAAMYKARRSGTAVINIAGDLVPKRIGEIFGQPIVREPLESDATDAVAKAWAEDVDREGTPLGEWMEARAHDALVDEVVYIGIDSPDEDGTPKSLTKGDVLDDANLRPYAVFADARNVVDWEAKRGQLTRIVIAYEKRDKVDAYSKPTVSTSWIEWTPKVWRRYVADKEGNVTVDLERPHEFGRVPWRAVRPLKGAGYVARIAGLQKAALRTMSHLESEEVACVFTMLVFLGVAPEQVNGAKAGSGEAMVLNNTDASVQTISGEPAVIASLLSVLELKLAELYRCAESADKAARAQARSGIAEAYVFKGLAALLQTIAREFQAAENWLIETWALVMGMTPDEAKALAKSTYPTDFDVLSDEAIFGHYEWLLGNKGLPIEVRRRALADYVARLFPVSDKRRDEVLAAVDAWTPSAGESFMAGNDPVSSRFGALSGIGNSPDVGLLAGTRGL